MKKVFFAALALLSFGAAAQAQNIHPRVELGLNLARTQDKVDGNKVDGQKIRPGFRLAAAAEIDLASGIYLAPGLTFRQEGNKQNLDLAGLNGATTSVSTGLNYLSIPVNIGIRANLGEKIAVSVEAGPSFSYGLSSTSSANGVQDLFKAGVLKRFEAGLNASAAVEYTKVYLRLGTDIGMTNNLKNAVEKASQKNSSFYLAVGYRF